METANCEVQLLMCSDKGDTILNLLGVSTDCLHVIVSCLAPCALPSAVVEHCSRARVRFLPCEGPSVSALGMIEEGPLMQCMCVSDVRCFVNRKQWRFEFESEV